MMNDPKPPAPTYLRCERCDTVGYLPRDFCPGCGHAPLRRCRARGVATVIAATTMTRTTAGGPDAASAILLVLFDEGFTALARGAPALAPGDAVVAIGVDNGIVLVASADHGERGLR